jgi:hypothetical protein
MKTYSNNYSSMSSSEYAWNAGQKVSYWREEPLEAEIQAMTWERFLLEGPPRAVGKVSV